MANEGSMVISSTGLPDWLTTLVPEGKLSLKAKAETGWGGFMKTVILVGVVESVVEDDSR